MCLAEERELSTKARLVSPEIQDLEAWLAEPPPTFPFLYHNVKERRRKTNNHLPSETTPTASTLPLKGVRPGGGLDEVQL